MTLLEVLVREFLAIDRLATGALVIPKRGKSEYVAGRGENRNVPFISLGVGRFAIDHKNAGERGIETEITYIATSEITPLKHEVGDYTMELGALVSETFLASAKGAKVLYRFRDDFIVQNEVDSALLFCSGESQHGSAFFFFLSFCLSFFLFVMAWEGGGLAREKESER